MWVIYDHPLDYPDHFVIRVWHGEQAEKRCTFADTLQAARDKVERFGGSARMPRMPQDDPCIVEVWL